jgi:hypothetical protein
VAPSVGLRHGAGAVANRALRTLGRRPRPMLIDANDPEETSAGRAWCVAANTKHACIEELILCAP